MNLLERAVRGPDGHRRLEGVVTAREVAALEWLVASYADRGMGAPSSTTLIVDHARGSEQPRTAETGEVHGTVVALQPARVLVLSSLDDVPNEALGRLCIDFGTAMSKATLVRDGDGDDEEIHVLELGVPGAQQEVSQTMLVSSVYIDNEGKLWFGQAAVARSLLEGGDGSRQRLDNIKRRLSEDGLGDKVERQFNPLRDEVDITYGDMVLAYLAFLTWAVGECLTGLGQPLNLPRRYAMPCFEGPKAREARQCLERYLGEAQVIADTYSSNMQNGIPLKEFVEVVASLRSSPRKYPFVLGGLTEPLGVAGSLISWRRRIDMLAMVIDIGAGTSDLSLYRVLVDPDREQNEAIEIPGAARGITEAGNYLDRVLIECILKKAGITSQHPGWISQRGRLELRIRDYKETLFNDGSVIVTLSNDGTEDDVIIELDEFCALGAVEQFSRSLREAMRQALEDVNPTWINWIKSNPQRYLTVALTGGGAKLPMARELASGSITVRGEPIRVEPALSFPSWLEEQYIDLEEDYPRIAVSLGGARKTLIQLQGQATVTGDIARPPVLGGYFVTGA
jgi:molecular chaperone HscA